MNKIIISIIVIGCLLSTTILNVGGDEAIKDTKTLDTIVIYTPDSIIEYNQNLMIDYSYISKTDFSSIDSLENIQESGTNVDFAITNLNAWYSPARQGVGNDDWRYECYKFGIYNIGDDYSGSGHIKVSITIKHFDGSEVKQIWLDGDVDINVHEDDVICAVSFCILRIPQWCNASQAVLEITTTFPDNDLSNNEGTVDFHEGVTFWGEVYEKNIFGNTTYPDYATVQSDSDCNKLIGSGKITSFGTHIEGSHKFYTQLAPKNPEISEPYSYTVTAKIDRLQLRKQTKYTDPLDALSYREIFFTFFKLSDLISQSTQQSTPTPQTQPSTQPSSEPTSKTTTQNTISSTKLLAKTTSK